MLRLLPLPVLRERVGVRVLLHPGATRQHNGTLTLTLSRGTGRGDRTGTGRGDRTGMGGGDGFTASPQRVTSACCTCTAIPSDKPVSLTNTATPSLRAP